MPWLKIQDQVNGMKGYLDTNKVALGLGGVWYSDQMHYPTSPVGAVGHGRRRKSVTGARTLSVNTDIFVYLLTEELNITRSQREELIDHLADSFDDVIRSDPTLGHNVAFAFAREFEPGSLGRTKGSDTLNGIRVTVDMLTRETW